MAAATTLSEIEAAALAGLRGLIDVEIAYLARRERGIWTIGTEIGLEGDIAGVNIADEFVPYAEALRAGETICYERPKDMGFALSRMLTGLGLRSVFAVPIMRGDSCIGALAIGRPVPSRFSVRDRALVRLFTAHLSVLLAKRDLVASLETLAEAVPGLVLRTDPSGWIYWYNQRWYDYTGQTPEEAVGWGWQTAHHPVDFQRVIEEWPLPGWRLRSNFGCAASMESFSGIWRTWTPCATITATLSVGAAASSTSMLNGKRSSIRNAWPIRCRMHFCRSISRLATICGSMRHMWRRKRTRCRRRLVRRLRFTRWQNRFLDRRRCRTRARCIRASRQTSSDHLHARAAYGRPGRNT
jgi:PAS domain-containing protein